MAKLKMEAIVEQLDYDMKRALEAALDEVLPGTEVDRNDLYRAFRRAVGRKFNTWVTIPDRFITDWRE